eukprot:scaffold7.g3655.t1
MHAAYSAAEPPPAAALSPASQPLAGAVPWQEAPQGVTFFADGAASFRVWAPHAEAVALQVVPPTEFVPTPEAAPAGGAAGGDEGAARAAPEEVAQPGVREYALSRHGDDFGADLNIIYEMHVGSFTPEGTLRAAIARLPHVAALGFTLLELMPCQEHSDPWGYNPRQLLALDRRLGTPEDMAAFVDAAHGLGMGVMMDLVLHHGAPDRNMLWDFDGWEESHNGGIYHEGAPDCPWGRQWAFWKGEVRRMIVGAAEAWLRDYRMDGLRFDSIKDVPMDMVQARGGRGWEGEVTWAMRQGYPGRILTAEITPEDPRLMEEYGFDAIWVHSGYFDIIQQHRALGRGHHGGGDFAAGWDLERLRTAMGVHYGFESPVQCIKYMTGSHDQVGCQRNGGFYQDYQPIGGHHRQARAPPWAVAPGAAGAAAAAAAAGGGEREEVRSQQIAQNGWWHVDEHHRLQWDLAEDEIGKGMMAAVRDVNLLRAAYPALRYGWSNCIHEDRQHGVMGYERVAGGEARVIVVVNAARHSWQSGEYGMWVGGGGAFEQVYCSQDPAYGGDPAWVSNGVVPEHDGRIFLNLPASCTLMLVQQG